MNVLLLALGLGLCWHGVQVIWVAPTPRQLQRDQPSTDPQTLDSARAFQLFWLDQYAWLGISLTVIGITLVLVAWL